MAIRSSLSAVVLLIAPAVAQQMMPPVRQPFAQLKQFLGLTDAQVETMQRNIEEQGRAMADKQARIFELHKEIAEETAKPTPDPHAIGTDYVAIEMICRELRDRGEEVQKANLALLTPDQKTRLKVLEDALKLWPTIMEAQAARLLEGGSLMGASFTSSISGVLVGQSNTMIPANRVAARPVAGCMTPMFGPMPMPVPMGSSMGPGNRLPMVRMR